MTTPESCPTEGCKGDPNYSAPGRGHSYGCPYPLKEEDLPTTTIDVQDENFRRTVDSISPTIERVISLGYRGLVTGLEVADIDRMLYDLGLVIGQLEALRAKKSNTFDSASHHEEN